VQSRWSAYQQNLKFFAIVEKIGWHKTIELIPDEAQVYTKGRHFNALFSQVHRILRRPIKNLVLDEAHIVKNAGTATHKAIADLYYECIYMLSGTFIPNRWNDLYGLVTLIPGHPFRAYRQFMMSFARKESNGIYTVPSVSKRNRLIKFLQAFVISRPATLLELEGMEKQSFEFLLTEDDAALVVYYVDKFLRAMRKTPGSQLHIGDSSSNGYKNDYKTMGMLQAMKAQQVCANRNMVRHQATSLDEVGHAQGKRLLEEYQTTASELANKGLMKGLLQSLTERAKTTRPRQNESLVRGGNGASVSEEVEEMDLDTVNEDEPDWSPDMGDPDKAIGIKQAVEDETEPAITTQTAQDRVNWLQKVRELSNEDLLSPKVAANLKLLNHIYMTWPGEKIIVFSKMLQYLDILYEAIKRDPAMTAAKVTPLRFDGTLDSEERRQVCTDFANPESHSPILVTVGAGGAGPNLTAGTKVIQCEPWWNATGETQAYSRSCRFGQSKVVHVWVLRGMNSLIDLLMEDTRDKKVVTNEQIMGPLRRKDGEKVVVPRQYKHGLGE
jgi:SNF2 family DNA or RNA helicase